MTARTSGARAKLEPPVRHVDGDSELVIDTSHMPLLITTWFGSPTLGLAEIYTRWFEQFVEQNRARGLKFVVLDDAVRAGRPAPPVRGQLAQVKCPGEVVIDRIIIVNTAAIRGAITALSWATGIAIKTTPAVEDGVRDCLQLLDDAGVARPHDFRFEPAQPSTPR